MMDRLLREGNPPAGQLASPKPQYKDVQTNSWEELKGEGGASYVKDKDVFAKLEQARALLDAISGKDFATQTTLAAVLAKLADLESELATIKANQLSGDQKVQLSGTMAQNVISRAVRRDSVLNTNVTVPDWAKGAIVEHIIYAATGTFQPGDEGASLAVYGRDSKYRASVWALRFKHIAGSSVIQQAYIYPGADFGDISTVGSFNEILVGALPLPRRLRIDVVILGDFDVEQGIDSEVNIMWLR